MNSEDVASPLAHENGHADRSVLDPPRHPQIVYTDRLFDCYQSLLVKLCQPSNGSGMAARTIGVTCCQGGQGASTVACNLTAVAARTWEREVLLVDAHFERPSLDRTLRVPRAPGLRDYLAGDASLAECFYDTSLENFTILPAGAARGISDSLLDAHRLAALFEELRENFNLVVVDLPPIEELGACLSFASHLDGVLLVVAAERVSARLAQAATNRLRRVGINMLGAVLNGQRRHRPAGLNR